MISKRIGSGLIWGLILVAVGLRLWGYWENPVSTNWDEASHAVNAKLVSQLGVDEWGVRWPRIFRAFGDYKLPVYIYASTIPVALFGVNALSVRLVSVLAGIISCVVFYWLLRREFRDARLAASGLVLFLIVPWHFFLSRVALEANLSLMLILLGTYGLVCGGVRGKNAGLISFALAMQTYNSARVVVPILLFWVYFVAFKQRSFGKLWIGTSVVMLSAALVVLQVWAGTGLSRYEKLSLLSPNNLYQIGLWRQESGWPEPLPRLVYNKATYVLYRVVDNYRAYFSVGFLTQTDGPQAQFAIPGQNLVFWSGTGLAAFGFCYLALKKRRRLLTIVGLLLVAILPAALTDSPPQALRPLYAIPVLVYMMVWGIKSIMEWRQGVIAILLVILCLGLEVLGFQWRLWKEYPMKYSGAWQYGHRQLVEKLRGLPGEYDRVIMTKYYGEPHVLLAFYGAYPASSLVPSESNVRFAQSGWYWTDRVGKYYFVNDWDIGLDSKNVRTESGLSLPLSRSILVTTEERQFPGSRIIDRVKDLSGKTVFVIARYE